MAAMAMPGRRFRAIALLAGAAFALHQLRYLLAYGSHSHAQLELQGHGYLSLLVPIVVSLGLLAVLAFVVCLAAAYERRRGERPLASTATLWMRSSAALLAIYGTQEWLEGAVAHGHGADVAGLLARGGWLAIPLAIAFGALLAFLLKGAELAIDLVARRSVERRPATAVLQTARERSAERPALDAIALFLAGRGPPLTSH
jgi:hypothetical protein